MPLSSADRPNPMKEQAAKYAGIIAGAACILIALVLSKMPEVAETVYRNGIYKLYRHTWGQLTEWIDLPFMPILFLILGLGLLRALWQFRQTKELKLRTALNMTGLLLTWFFVSWGWNYACPEIQDKNPRSPSEATLNYFELAELATSRAGELRNNLPYMQVWHPDSAYFERLQPHVYRTLQKLGFSPSGAARVKQLGGNGFMRKLGIAGIYFPFAGEGYTDRTYMAPERNFILAHECAHVYGVTDEGEANLVAFLALVNSGEPGLEYAAWIELIRYLIPRDAPEEYLALVPEVVASDIQMLRDQKELFQGYFPWVSIQANNFYLHAMGVEDGIESYGYFPDLVALYLDMVELND